MSAGRVLVAGVDEVGRGPLAGPVVTAAVILDPECPLTGLADSKQLEPGERLRLAAEIRQCAVGYAIGRCSAAEIARHNIRGATLLAMSRAVAALPVVPAQVLVDGRDCPPLHCPVQAVVGGDASEPCISAASILAKVVRDQEMIALDRVYPGYGFAAHKGYATPAHRDALRRLGPCPVHRRGFAPVDALLDAGAGDTQEAIPYNALGMDGSQATGHAK